MMSGPSLPTSGRSRSGPPPSGSPHSGPRAGPLFAALVGAFVLVFAALLVWLVVDQGELLSATGSLHERTLPEALEQQRLARNLEVLRLEGERVLFAQTVEARRQAMFVVTLMASHPSLLGNARTRDLAIESELLLSRIARATAIDDAMRAEWSQVSLRLSLAADDISATGVAAAREDVQAMTAVVVGTRDKLYVTAALMLVFACAVLLLIRQLLVRPLQRFDAALTHLREKSAAEELPAGRLREVRAVAAALGQLRSMLQENEETRRNLERLASTDMLTGLNNRRQFMAFAHAEVARAQRYGRPITIALADLDHFKLVNDDYGHEAGDAVLKAFADLVREILRTSDIAGRYGGEEFAFVFPETTPQEASVLAERLRARTEELALPIGDGRHVRLTISLGVADASVFSVEEALRCADMALYEAKESGRNAVVLSPAGGLSLPG